MPAPDFGLAPPPTPVDGLLAVPIDVQQVTATVTLDASTSTARADVTMTYAVGPTAGNPLFDLRQTIEEAWLDGTPIAPALLAAHDVGAGTFSTVRIIDAMQAAGTIHTLRLTYTLGIPDAQLTGSYPPSLEWSAGPAVRWSFGFSDLNAGRYLEAWFPSNLIFDQFPVELDIHVTGTATTHVLITNGAVTELGANHWSVHFPDRFAPLAPLVEIRAADTLESATGSVVLPVTGTVTIDAWKLAGGPEDLATCIDQAKAFLTANESDYGPYLGDRYVMFFHGAEGGMEYSGATTTSLGALGHETFHSWFARGISPSSQADGWWDEGFTTFHDAGADDVDPFDFLAPPVELCSRQPFQRRTSGNAYRDGSRFFRGVAAQIGVAPLRTAMHSLYQAHRGQPVSTSMIEEHLVAQTGAPALVDAFHRFVFGYADPSPAPRLLLRDVPANSAFWESTDVWIRHADDGGTSHLDPKPGQDNWFYARVRGDPTGGACRHFTVTFNVKEFAGTEFVYPDDFLPCIAARTAFDLEPGETRIISTRWPGALVPAAGAHLRLLASAQAHSAHPTAALPVRDQPNLAQRTLSIVDLIPGEFVILPVVLANPRRGARTVLEVWRDSAVPNLDVALVHRTPTFFASQRPRLRPLAPSPAAGEQEPEYQMDCGGCIPPCAERSGGMLTAERAEGIARRFPGGVEHPVGRGARVRIPIALAGGESTVAGLKVTAPAGLPPGTVVTTHLALRQVGSRRISGGATVSIRVHSPD